MRKFGDRSCAARSTWGSVRRSWAGLASARSPDGQAKAAMAAAGG